MIKNLKEKVERVRNAPLLSKVEHVQAVVDQFVVIIEDQERRIKKLEGVSNAETD